MGEFGVCEEGDGSGDGGKQGGEGRDKGVLYEAGNPENRSSTIQLSLGLTVLVNNPPEVKRLKGFWSSRYSLFRADFPAGGSVKVRCSLCRVRLCCGGSATMTSVP